MSRFLRYATPLFTFLLLVSCGGSDAPWRESGLRGLIPEERRVTAETGGQAVASFDFENTGSHGVPVRAVTSAPWLRVQGATSALIPAGAGATVTVVASCGDRAEARSATVTIEADDGDTPPLHGRVRLTCEEPAPYPPTDDGGPDDSGGSEPEPDGDGADGDGEPAPGDPDGSGGDGGPDDGDAGEADPFDITLIFYGSQPSATQRRAFENAAARWAEVLTDGHPERRASIGAGSCGGSHPSYEGPVDDLIVFAGITTIDGRGGILARAGYCRIDAGTGLPYAGLMEFDEADVRDLEADGLFRDTVLHEMGHVLGIGTLWRASGHLDPPCEHDGPESRFTGGLATEQHRRAGGDGSPYVETNHGAGTACGHWDEDRYQDELMTGFIDRAMPLSAITVGSLADLGYRVDLAAADDYQVPSRLRLQAEDRGERLVEELIAPAVEPD